MKEQVHVENKGVISGKEKEKIKYTWIEKIAHQFKRYFRQDGQGDRTQAEEKKGHTYRQQQGLQVDGREGKAEKRWNVVKNDKQTQG